MNWKKVLLIALGAAIFAGVGLPIYGNQNEVEFRIAGRVRDFCYGDAGYSDPASHPPPELIRKCGQPIREYENRDPLRLGFGALAGLAALLPYLAVLWLLRRRRRDAQPT